ncbi:Transcription elongation factor SPT4 [Ascosphaera acerosa]|nr:Transcription elongation factor SPT4 [Ascosphaera acerosa]
MSQTPGQTFYVASNQQRTLRACMVCGIVQLNSSSQADFPRDAPVQRFIRDGCPNCEEYLGLRGNSEAVQECTSQVYEGIIALADPATSWVAKYQRLDGYVPGTYAVKVTGIVCFLFLAARAMIALV